MDKLITEKLINERLEAKGFGEKQVNNEGLAKKSVLKHYGVEFTDRFDDNADFYVYEESTADGYSVWVATHDTKELYVSEHVYYYDHDLHDALKDHIKYCNGDEEFPEKIYVEDTEAGFIDDAVEELFVYLVENIYEEEVTNELIDEGYVQN
jgi:hypothetical protein